MSPGSTARTDGGVRVTDGGQTITYSGDTEWTPELVDAADGADLFGCEAYFFERKTLSAHRAELRSRRVALTHMSAEMLDRVGELPDDVLVAEVGAPSSCNPPKRNRSPSRQSQRVGAAGTIPRVEVIGFDKPPAQRLRWEQR
jgi:hypothetical protein